MLTALVALSALAQGAPAARPNVDAGALVSKMLFYYYDAETLTGTIKLSINVEGQSTGVITNVQFEKPSKLFIRQQKTTGDQTVWLTVSDGKAFVYHPGMPNDNPGKRLVEPVTVGTVTQDIRKIYSASSAGLVDRSAPLDIAIGRSEDLNFLRGQWATLQFIEKQPIEGGEVNVVGGYWKPYGSAEKPKGSYSMYITDSGELKGFTLTENISNETGQVLKLVSRWDVNLVKNGKPDQSLFKVK